MTDTNITQAHDSRSVPPQAGKEGARCAMPPTAQPGIEERIAETGLRIAALQRRLDGALADVRHARRRAAADLALASNYALADMARALLPFKDALEAALAVETTDVPALRRGLELAGRQLEAALARRHA
ncbi:nucleotide exchange factor GrpE [Massilia consociata]|uniref:Nucleotide exchange factor GrpE n=1 Tax=Massilia consociata TaxID=760117 RepID=A0ABV6FAD7_9BURK